MKAVVLHQAVRASRAELWAACATPEGMQRWQADEVSGRVQMGGRVALGWPALGARTEVEVVEISEGHKLVVRLGPAATRTERDETLAAFELSDGGVRLTLSGIASEEEAQGSASAWRLTLAILAHHLEQHPRGKRSVSWAFRSVSASAASAYMCFTDPKLVSAWLGKLNHALETVGEPYSVALASGVTMSGRVLAITPGRDVALSWSEDHDSAIAFRTLPSSGARRDRLVALCWSRWDAPAVPPAIWSSLHGAVNRLARLLTQQGDA